MEKSCNKCIHGFPDIRKEEFPGCIYCETHAGYMRPDSADVCKCYREETDANPEPEPKADKGKPRLTLVPLQILWDIAEVRRYGVEVKYPETGVDGWRSIGEQRIRDALFRHVVRYMTDPEGMDEESGLPHLWHAACNVAFLCEIENAKPGTQTEKIIRCRNCVNFVPVKKDSCFGDCAMLNISVMDDDYCSSAKEKTGNG